MRSNLSPTEKAVKDDATDTKLPFSLFFVCFSCSLKITDQDANNSNNKNKASGTHTRIR